MKTGIVKFFNDEKGFGFIIDDATKKEIFVHVTAVLDDLRVGDKVEFFVQDGAKGPTAVDVRIAD